MIELILLSSALLGFLIVLLGTPLAEEYLAASGILGIDQQKQEKPRVPTSGGTIVLLGFVVALSFFSGAVSLFTNIVIDEALIFAALTSTSLIALIGLIDDVHVDLSKIVGEEIERDILISDNRTVIHEKADFLFGAPDPDLDRKGLSQAAKMSMVLPAVLPLIAVGAGSWTMSFPFIGAIEWGLIYPLVLLPVGLMFVSNAVNMLAGVNGLEAGLSLVASIALGVFAFQNGRVEASAIAFVLSSSLLAFLVFNRYPSSILPGDSLTYLSGAAMFSVMVAGNMEKFAVVLFVPWMIEFFLKARARFDARSWGKIQDDGELKSFYINTYSLTHIFMDRGLNEKQIAQSMVGLMVVWAAFALLLFNYVPFLNP